MPKKFAQIDKQNNTVVNVIMLNDASEWTDEAFFVIEADVANIGDVYQDGVFVAQ